MKDRFWGITSRCGVFLGLALVWSVGYGLQLDKPLVATGWLADNLEQVVVLDVRKDARTFAAKPKKLKSQAEEAGGTAKKAVNLKTLTGHIPGAVSVPWKKSLVKRKEGKVALKAMLPTAKAFEELMQALGVNDTSAIVVVGRGVSAAEIAHATRLYWTLKYFGHDNVALLNAGTAKWAKEGRALAYDKPTKKKGDFTVQKERGTLLASAPDVERAVAKGDVQIVDARGEDYYLGLNYHRKFANAQFKGHIPGAKTLPFVLLVQNWPPATFYSMDDIRKVAALKGVDLGQPSIFYCNSGVACTVPWFVAYELEGNTKARVFDGSMNAWSNVPTHEVVGLK